MPDPDEDEGFVYDILGNRITLSPRVGGDVVYASNTVNEYTDIGGVTPLYDACGNLTKDLHGLQYAYDYDNRITQIKDSGDDVVWNYTYDALGRRIEKHDADPVNKIRYYYDGQRVLLETNDSNNDERAFVYGNYIDEVLIMTDYTDEDDPDYYYGHDHLYSVAVIFDEDGDVYERAKYNAYGQVQILAPNYAPRTTSLCNNPYYFTGRRRDTFDEDNYNIYYYRARYYDAETGRFISRDPFGVDPAGEQKNPFGCLNQYRDGMSLYQYVASNPIAYLDPYGLKPLFSMTGFNIQEYDMWEWVTGLFNIPIYMYVHGGLVVNKSTVDFGPEQTGALAGPGEVPHGTGPGESTKPLYKRKTGLMLEGPNKYKRCCKLTERNVLNCIKYVAAMWDNMYFIVGFQDCRGFKNNVIYGCCLTRKKP